MRILYATDGSEGALAGAHVLASLPLTDESTIDVLTVLEQDSAADVEPALSAARTALSGSRAKRAEHSRWGNAAEQILDAAEEQRPDLLVVGTRGQSALSRFLLGSVAERVVRHASCPVLVARPLRDCLDRVVLGIDGSEHSRRAADWLNRFPLPAGCEVRLVTIVTPDETVSSSRMLAVSPVAEQILTLARQEKIDAKERLDALAASFIAGGKRATIDIRADEPAQGLIAIANETQADLVVVGAQGLSAIDRFLIGSISERVLRHVPCSVMIVRHSPGENEA